MAVYTKNVNTVVNGFMATPKLSSAPNDLDINNGSNPPKTNESEGGETAATPSNGAGTDCQEVPLPASTGILGAMDE